MLLLRLAALFAAARFAGSIAERLRVPAVFAEIGAGIILGPSLLRVVEGGEPLSFLGELGAILLLLEVGLHMDIADLRRVGGPAMQVAWIGIVAPFAGAYVAVQAFGIEGSAALFLAAGITATSVGITARVFADMRVLASAESQTVLGAAVADDVIGLLILTVVATLSTGGTIAASTILGITATGLGFLAAVTVFGSWLMPKLFTRLGRSRIDGSLIGAAVAFTLLIAGLASSAKLAPIVGAFVAGVVLNRTPQRDEIRRALAPVGHLFVPVFFLLIGAETHIHELLSPRVLLVAGVLTLVAIAGKVVSGLGLPRRHGDRLLVGIGMIPRGEVGLVFATLGLTTGALDASEHAILLAVVLVTTLAAPPWLRHRIERNRRRCAGRAEAAEPVGGWLAVGDRDIELRAAPPDELVGRIALEAALLCADRRPGPRLLEHLQAAQPQAAAWDHSMRTLFLSLLRNGSDRSWRLLDITGMLAVLFPDLEPDMRRAASDPFDLDPGLRWRLVESLKELVADPRGQAGSLWAGVDQDVVLLAAFLLSVTHDRSDAPARLAHTFALDDGQARTLRVLVDERSLLFAASARIRMGSEESVLELAAHIGDRATCDALYLLAAAQDIDPMSRQRLSELHALITEALAQPELGEGAVDVVEARRRHVARLLPAATNIAAHRLLEAAPRRYLLAHAPHVVARHLQMLDPPPTRHEIRLFPDPHPATGAWTLYVATADRATAFGAVASALATHGVPIVEASLTTFPNGLVADIFRVAASSTVDWDSIRRSAAAALTHRNGRNGKPVVVEGRVEIDNAASPWHTIVEIRAADRSGLLSNVAHALERSGIHIHHATVRTDDGVAFDTFLVTGPNGHKLDRRRQAELRLSLEGRLPPRWTPARIWRRPAEALSPT